MPELDLSSNNLKKFGRSMCLCLLAIGLILFLKHRPVFKVWWFLGFLFLLSAQMHPAALKPIYKIWMILAFCLGWINTRLILLVVFYLLVTPIGLLARLFRKDFLDIKFNKDARSYWQKREPGAGSKDRYERIF